MSTSEFPFFLLVSLILNLVLVYITLPASPTTETLYTVSQANSALESAAATTTSNAVTVTVTSSVVSTQTISVVHVTPPAGDGIYSFTVDNDTTSWFGGQTPPSTASLISSTAFVTLQPVLTPVSVSTVSPSQSADSTSYLTLSSTIVTANPSPPVLELVAAQTTSYSDLSTKTTSIDVTVTETSAHYSKYKASASAGLYFGQARNGWNATMTTLFKPKGPTNLSLNVAERGTLQGTSHPKETCTSISVRLPKARNGRSRLLKPRQVGGIVIDTIDGHVVSWTNEFDGQTPSTSKTVETPLLVSTTVQAVSSHLAGKCCTSYPIWYLY